MYIGSLFPCLALEQDGPAGYCASSALAEQICTPGATMSGLIRPSSVLPWLENEATWPTDAVNGRPVVDAPTVRTFLAVDGGDTVV